MEQGQEAGMGEVWSLQARWAPQPHTRGVKMSGTSLLMLPWGKRGGLLGARGWNRAVSRNEHLEYSLRETGERKLANDKTLCRYQKYFIIEITTNLFLVQRARFPLCLSPLIHSFNSLLRQVFFISSLES